MARTRQVLVSRCHTVPDFTKRTVEPLEYPNKQYSCQRNADAGLESEDADAGEVKERLKSRIGSRKEKDG